MMDGSFNRCFLVTFLVFAVIQNILIAGTNGHISPDDCYTELVSCVFRAIQPYMEVSEEEALAKARTTSFAMHCTDWNGAMTCKRRHLTSDVCQNVTSLATKKIIKFINVIDVIVNYSCKKNFHRINRFYRCVLDRSLLHNITDQCIGYGFNESSVCQKIPEFVECSANGVSRCGSDASDVARELVPQVLEAYVEAEFDGKKCPHSKLDKSNDITSVLKRFFSRK